MSVDVTGTWRLTLRTPIGVQDVVLEIDRAGDVLTGTARGAGEEVACEDLVVDGRHLRWRQRIRRPLRLDLAFEVEVDPDGEALHGTSRAGRLPASRVSGVRVPRA